MLEVFIFTLIKDLSGNKQKKSVISGAWCWCRQLTAIPSILLWINGSKAWMLIAMVKFTLVRLRIYHHDICFTESLTFTEFQTGLVARARARFWHVCSEIFERLHIKRTLADWKTKYNSFNSDQGISSEQIAPLLLDPKYFCQNRPDLVSKDLLWGEGDSQNKAIHKTLDKHKFKLLMRIELHKSVHSKVAANMSFISTCPDHDFVMCCICHFSDSYNATCTRQRRQIHQSTLFRPCRLVNLQFKDIPWFRFEL